MIISHLHSRKNLELAVLICAQIVIYCVSLVGIASYEPPIGVDFAAFHIFLDPARWYVAVTVVAAFALLSSVFVVARFSFGYFAGFSFYMMILGYLWIVCFTDLNYDHRLARFSAAASAIAFLLPALFISSPVRQVHVLSATAFDRLLTFIFFLAGAIVVAGAAYNFRFVAIADIYDFRDKMEFPAILNYLIGMASSALLPFAFAGFIARKAYWRAGTVLLLLLFFYPITLSKLALLSPFWLVAILLLSKLVEARIAVVLSLLVPMLAGLFLVSFFRAHAAPYFSIVNFRMIAIPATAMDVYSDFFSRHDLTYFCQISVLKGVMHCPYQEPLSIVMERAYKLGHFNASLFATEGIASVGTLFAPVTAMASGLVIAVGNRLSAGLPAGFILVSGAVIPQVLLNVPLTTVLLTHGAGLLLLLWYITPRSVFERGTVGQTAATG